MTKDIPLKYRSSTVTGKSFWRDGLGNYWSKEMKDNFDEKDGPTCVLHPNIHTLVIFSEHQNRLVARWGGEFNNNVFQADHKDSSC